ncbi:MAG: zinc-ribbon domain-containing protein [Lachnospiraceae bacterium]|nr:zinc-ribbon domain-containing protein [Lachnospiraceae bacterium]
MDKNDNSKICPSCGKELPSDCVFCVYCGTGINKEESPIEELVAPHVVQKQISGKEKGIKASKAAMILSTACVFFVGIAVAEFFILNQNHVKDLTALNSRITELDKENDSLRLQLVKSENALDELKDNSKSLHSAEDYQKMKEMYDNAYNELSDIRLRYARYSNLNDILNGCATSNGTISVDSVVYAVKKGEYTTINVNWPNYETTAYLHNESSQCVDAEWVNNNIRIYGKSVGNGVLTLSMEDNADPFKICVFCYDNDKE